MSDAAIALIAAVLTAILEYGRRQAKSRNNNVNKII